jgi:hypothetical protein
MWIYRRGWLGIVPEKLVIPFIQDLEGGKDQGCYPIAKWVGLNDRDIR